MIWYLYKAILADILHLWYILCGSSSCHQAPPMFLPDEAAHSDPVWHDVYASRSWCEKGTRGCNMDGWDCLKIMTPRAWVDTAINCPAVVHNFFGGPLTFTSLTVSWFRWFLIGQYPESIEYFGYFRSMYHLRRLTKDYFSRLYQRRTGGGHGRSKLYRSLMHSNRRQATYARMDFCLGQASFCICLHFALFNLHALFSLCQNFLLSGEWEDDKHSCWRLNFGAHDPRCCHAGHRMNIWNAKIKCMAALQDKASGLPWGWQRPGCAAWWYMCSIDGIIHVHRMCMLFCSFAYDAEKI